MNASTPIVSVVVPLGPMLDHLDEQLEALFAQQWEGSVELVLSCNGVSTQRLEQRGLPAIPENWNVVLVDSSAVRGPSHARNVGWRAAAAADLVLFCDADDVVAAGWIEAMVEGLLSAEVCGGALEFARLNPAGTGAWGRIAVDDLPRKFSHHRFVPSGNLGVRRAVLEELGGFDESLQRSEDVDFSWRAQDAGHRAGFVRDAVVSCRRRGSFAALWSQAREDAANDPALLRLHRASGAMWRGRDSMREAAGVAVAVLQAPFGAGHRAKLATRSGRFLGHLLVMPGAVRQEATR